MKGKIGVIGGAGVMGQALIQGMLEAKLATPKQIWIATRSSNSAERTKKALGVRAYTDYEKGVAPELKATSLILLAVKPSQVEGVIRNLREAGLKSDTLILSVAAGVTTASIEEWLGSSNPVIRAMPNTPCVVRQGMTAVCKGKNAEQKHIHIAKKIFEAVGACIDLDESHFDAMTGLGGSGPAYLYLIMEALADGGVRVGLPRATALKIVAQTVLGAAAMVVESGRHPAALRDDVTTPAGCTIGALLTMEDGKIRSVLARAVEEATRIASGLGRKN